MRTLFLALALAGSLTAGQMAKAKAADAEK